MKLKLKSPLLIAGLWLAACFCDAKGAPAQEPDVIAAVKKTTQEFTVADKAAATAHTALLAAREALNTTRFGSAAYNARISAQQLAAAKEKYEKAAPEAKADALETYELAQELDAQRKTALEAAEKLLPQREAEVAEAQGKFAAGFAAAETAVGQIQATVRQGESEVKAKQKDSKVGIEKAAFTQAAAEQKAAGNAAIGKTMTALATAEAALSQAVAAAKQASESERGPKLAAAEKATRAYLLALNEAAQNLPALHANNAATLMGLCDAFVKADDTAQKATAAQQQAKQSLDENAKAVQQSEERIKAAREGAEKRVAKIRAQKDLAREQETLQRAQAAKAEAQTALAAKTAEAEKAQQACTGALQTAVKTLALTAEAEKALADDKAAIAKAIADRQSELKREGDSLTREAADARTAADKAGKELVAAEKTTAERVAVRENLLKTMRQHFLRDLRLAYDEREQHNTAVTAASKDLQTKTATQTKARGTLDQAKEALARIQKEATTQAASVASATQAKLAAEKSLQEKLAAKTAAERKAADTLAAAKTAKEAAVTTSAESQAVAEKQAKDADAEAKASAKHAREAGDAAKVAQAACDKSIAALKAVEKRRDEIARAEEAAGQKIAGAEAALEKAVGETKAVEETVTRQRQLVAAATDRLDVAKAGSQGGLKPLAASSWDISKARHLMIRAGFGGTPDEVAKLHAMGLHGAVSHLVDFRKQPPADVAFVAYPKEKPELYESTLMSEDQRRLRQSRVDSDRRQIQDMRSWWIKRMIESPRPLEEKMTLFWHGQIPVQFTTVGDSYYMYLQNELYRNNAAGSFTTLLHGVAHDAAMLKYLNNDSNVKGRANENLAREIMELFSMGRDQGYSEIDIRQGARALTGYTYDADTGQFRFISDRHDTESKTIFGKSGNWCGDDFVRLILDTPYPARFVARQIFSFFAHSEPSLETVESLATVLRLNNYEVAPMLENLFLSEEFYSTRAMGTEVKSPVELIVGLHRDLGLKSPDYAYLANAVRDMGQDLFEPPSVFGWQGGRSWITTSRILGRYNVLAEVLEKRPRAGKTGIDLVGGLLAGKNFASHAEVLDYLVKSVWVTPLSDAKRQALIEFLKPLPEPGQWSANPGPTNARLTRLLVILLCTPEAQLG